MDGMTVMRILLAAACVSAAGLGIAYILQRRRIRRLAERLEDFLVMGGEPLLFSVREDPMAPLINACAELENSLLRARESQEEECRRTGDLIADISHQLKTPLASLRLFCEMDESCHVAEQLSQIDRMERLIYSLLRLERLCADGYAFAFAERSAAAVMEASWAGLRDAFPLCRMEISGDAVIRCDEKWLGEAFVNLLKNACEHMPRGGVIRVAMECTEAAFFCTMEDEGGGVGPKDLHRLFERFYRAEGTPSAGAGIGLAIVREILWRHHGSVSAENGVRGLRISLYIPIMDMTRS